jgi:tRNA nucleotidyltransferase/poly(A) polymerase
MQNNFRADTEAINLVRDFLAAGGRRAWLVGGTVRDLERGLEPKDIDLATEGDPQGPARAFADAIGGSYFVLSEDFTTCRVVTASGTIYDFQRCRGGSIEADLEERDFTLDAMALPLTPGADIIDPLGGRDDLAAGRLVAVGEKSFADDPLRLLRAVRLEKDLALRLTPETEKLVRASAMYVNEPAAERRFHELVRILEAPGSSDAVRRMDELDLLEEVLPEIAALKGITQNSFHHLDVFDHVLAAADAMGELLSNPATYFPATADAINDRLDSPLAGDATRRQMLSVAAIVHDVGKPGCRFTDEEERVRFFNHDRLSATQAEAILSRFRASKRTTGAVTQLVRQHMHLVALVNERDISERARVRYLRATHPYTPEAVLLSTSDRLAVRGPASTNEEIELHLEFARAMMKRYFSQADSEPLPRLVDGTELMKELGLDAGPRLGRILSAIEEEQEMGAISSHEEALSFARSMAEKTNN